MRGMMNETPVPPKPLHESTPLESTNPVAIGSTIGGTTAMGLALCYAFALVPYFGLLNFFGEITTSHDFGLLVSKIAEIYMAMGVEL